jgi:hypothetical protein
MRSWQQLRELSVHRISLPMRFRGATQNWLHDNRELRLRGNGFLNASRIIIVCRKYKRSLPAVRTAKEFQFGVLMARTLASGPGSCASCLISIKRTIQRSPECVSALLPPLRCCHVFTSWRACTLGFSYKHIIMWETVGLGIYHFGPMKFFFFNGCPSSLLLSFYSFRTFISFPPFFVKTVNFVRALLFTQK